LELLEQPEQYLQQGNNTVEPPLSEPASWIWVPLLLRREHNGKYINDASRR
jgi:hypothetical protein